MFDNLFAKYVTIKNIIFGIIAILAIIFVFKNIDIALVFFASFVIACSLNPIVDKIDSYAKISRNTASAIVLSGTALVCILIIVPTIFMAASEMSSFAVKFPVYIDEADDFLTKIPFAKHLGYNGVNTDAIASALSAYSEEILSNIINIGKNVGSSIVYFIISCMITFYFMSDKKNLKKAYLNLFPSEMRSNAENIINIISQKIGGYMSALIITMTSVGIVMVIGLMILGVPYALLLGLITAVMDIIPVVGPAIAFLICIVTTYQAGLPAVLSVIAVFAIAQIVENNLVRPYVFGKFLDIHPLLIYLFLFIAAKYMGVTGVIFAPAIAATICVLTEELYIKSLN